MGAATVAGVVSSMLAVGFVKGESFLPGSLWYWTPLLGRPVASAMLAEGVCRWYVKHSRVPNTRSAAKD
jgi:hypothetical protein